MRPPGRLCGSHVRLKCSSARDASQTLPSTKSPANDTRPKHQSPTSCPLEVLENLVRKNSCHCRLLKLALGLDSHKADFCARSVPRMAGAEAPEQIGRW